ncbi:hypothetical protein AAKU64_004234 [Undibacterium sp. GrIS 1.8]|uniref:hypothetical protein n=1 Tax=Undibacterium sp. GrIS 1.8 TaxID=3143934 RepID=UPI00339349BF
MITLCPKCQSDRIDTKNYAKKTGGTIGTVAGVVFGAAGVVTGAELGAATGVTAGLTAGLIAGPIGSVIGSIAGAIIGGLVGGTAGCTAGAKFGEMVDETILDNYHCLECDYHFSQQTVNTTLYDASDHPAEETDESFFPMFNPFGRSSVHSPSTSHSSHSAPSSGKPPFHPPASSNHHPVNQHPFQQHPHYGFAIDDEFDEAQESGFDQELHPGYPRHDHRLA